MKKLLRTDIKIPFGNPYVVRLDYNDVQESVINADRRKLIKRCTETMGASWGYSKIVHERGPDREVQPLILNGTNISPGWWAPTDIPRIYFCFADEIDALQFRLTISTRAQQVKIWPIIPFSIFEYVEDDVDTDFLDGEEYGDFS